MAINEAVNIEVDVKGTTTVQQAASAYEDLGDAVSKTQLEAERLAQQYGITDKRTQEAIKVAGRYKQEMEELDFAIDAARGGSDQLFRAAQGVTAGFELAAGATALFGSESEELEKVLLRVQGAMAFSQGIKDLKEFGPALLNLLKSLAGPVGLAIAAASAGVYALVDSFNNLEKSVGLSDEALESLAEDVSDSIAEVDKLTNAVQDETLSENQRLEALEQLKNQYPNYFENIGNDINNTQQLETAKSKLVDSLINEAKIRALQDEISNTYKESLAEEIRLTEEINKFRDAAAANQEKLNKKLAEGKITQSAYNTGIAQANQLNLKATNLEKQLTELQTTRQEKVKGLSRIIDESTSIIVNNGGATKQNTKTVEKSTETIEDNTEAIRKNNQEMSKLIENQNKLKGQTIETVTETGEATMRTTDATLTFVETQQKTTFQKLKLFVGAYGEDIKNSLDDVLSVSTEFTQNMSDKATKDYQKRIDKLKELGYTEEEISNMRDKELQKIDERGKRAFEMQKKLRYAQTLLSSIEGTQNAYTNAQQSPITAIFPAYPLVQAGLAAAFGIAQLQQISQSSYESKIKPTTSASGSSSNTSVPRFQAPLTQLPGTEEFTGESRVYVTEADISNTQRKVKVTEGISTVK